MIRKNKIKRVLKYKKVYVITSSIACGKSTFLKIAKENGIFCLSADEISTFVFLLKWKKIRKKLRISSKNDDLSSLKDKKNRVSSIIFKDYRAKKKLELMMHKRIKKAILHKINSNKSKIIFIEIPLYFENNNYRFLLNKIVIYCPFDLSLKRLMARNNLDKTDALNRLNSQKNIEYKKKYANYLVNNDENLSNFKDNSIKIIKKIKAKHDNR